ncbi:hypothetical protein N658DRAFT_499349 [Parathielavia hyrcaniae]|uniref:Infection structure specific protein n=1 Tax=Parathielavia hyrcaniae TaxID=113614 RepID=A0AAN6PZY0_9PEZI|nr:hypothetical protein N658DRAFT_499349 [Parathielavia hyrcaniae]
MHTTALIAALAGATLTLANPAPALAQPMITPAAAAAGMGPILAPRQQFAPTGDLGKLSSCVSDYRSLTQDVPTPTPRALSSVLVDIAESIVITATSSRGIDDSLTSLCAASESITPPASLSSAYESYTSAYNSWASSVEDEARSVASECGGQVSVLVEFALITDAQSCTSAVQDLVDWYEEMVSSATASGEETESSSTSAATETATETDTETETMTTTVASQTTGENTDAATTTTSTSTGGAAAARETGLVGAAAAVVLGVAGLVAAL